MRISVIIPAYNAAAYLRSCLERLKSSTYQDWECLVVDDGSTDDTAAVAREFGAVVVATGKKSGPAKARNLGAKQAKGDILFFIDADVCVYPDTLARVQQNFADDPALDAVMGSYDDTPQSPDFISQYKNLMHCFTHQHGRRQASTFWSGCGAIRRELFLSVEGFDESYRRPAIEDIELGYRLKRDGHKLLLDSDILVKHLKVWSFIGLVKTDIFDRGVPWTELILRDRFLPNDLNLQLSQRVSVALVFLLLGMAGLAAIVSGGAFLLPLLALAFLILAAYGAESVAIGGSPRALAGFSTLMGAIVVLASARGHFEIVPPVLLAFVLLFLRHRYAYTTPRRRRMTGLFCGVYLLFVILFTLTYLPYHPLVFGFFLVLSAIVALNTQFYVFLAAKGRLFALAAIPFHLLFHFYNGVSFLIGFARHALMKRTMMERRPSPASPRV